ncbi:DEKNAAC104083 [Brettanomyces naardenensis]|uniref:DEKNAAC104083 n=1 Tax=Brettanomyces naardenensis TaxID=13370 RepID=A0A448YQ10_BRENA|nr:DEKNAAC104083 [Brettanomyces naardenensis]
MSPSENHHYFLSISKTRKTADKDVSRIGKLRRKSPSDFLESPTKRTPSDRRLVRYQHCLTRNSSISSNSASSPSQFRNVSTSNYSYRNYSDSLASPITPPSNYLDSRFISDDDDDDESDGASPSPNCFEYFDTQPDLSSCDTSPETPPNGVRNDGIPRFRPLFGKKKDSVRRNLLSELITEVPAATIFGIPEILEIIIKYVGYDDKTRIPREPIVTRRPPLSYRHSVLIHGPDQGAKIWRRSISNSSISSVVNPQHRKRARSCNLYNCMMVNHLWFAVTREILNENVFFESDDQISKFNPNHREIKCKTLVLHKLRTTRQSQVDNLAQNTNPVGLKWIEFYICPKLTPPVSLCTEALVKLCIPGCRSISDDDLVSIIHKAPNLHTLDLRACEMITDASLYEVAQNCRALETLNVGRHLKGDLVSDHSICPIVRNCPIRTIGLAGCGITDRTIWELALLRGNRLERLSINHCCRLNDMGICQTIRRDMFKKLAVLEIRGLNLSDFRSVVEFKKRQLKRNITVLVESCEYLETKIRQTELQMDLEISNRIFSDIVDWLNDENDEDDRNLAMFRRLRTAS